MCADATAAPARALRGALGAFGEDGGFKVDDFEHTGARDGAVGQLEVAVHHAPGVHELDGLEQLPRVAREVGVPGPGGRAAGRVRLALRRHLCRH